MTLVEMSLTLGVAAAVLATGASSIHGVLDARKLDSAAVSMFVTLGLARSEAIKRRGPVVVCKSVEGRCANAGGWEQGWIMFHDENHNASLDAGEEIIQRMDSLGRGIRFTGNLQVARYVSFSSLGAPRTVGGAFQAGTLTACQISQRRTGAKQVVLSATGRVRLATSSAADCQ